MGRMWEDIAEALDTAGDLASPGATADPALEAVIQRWKSASVRGTVIITVARDREDARAYAADVLMFAVSEIQQATGRLAKTAAGLTDDDSAYQFTIWWQHPGTLESVRALPPEYLLHLSVRIRREYPDAHLKYAGFSDWKDV